MNVYCGIDWAEDHHDVAVVDEQGQLLAKRRIGDDAAGFRALLELLANTAIAPPISSLWPSKPAAAC